MGRARQKYVAVANYNGESFLLSLLTIQRMLLWVIVVVLSFGGTSSSFAFAPTRRNTRAVARPTTTTVTRRASASRGYSVLLARRGVEEEQGGGGSWEVNDAHHQRQHHHHHRHQPYSHPSSSLSFRRQQRETSSSSSSLLWADLGEYDPSEKLPGKRKEVLVGDPQLKVLKEKEMSVTSILAELAAIQQQGPQKYCVLGTRHCSYLHQQIIELLAYALVLSGNHVYTSGAGGTHAATIRGALRAERPDLLTVVLPQSLHLQPRESQDLLKDVTDVVAMPQNDEMSLDVASRICNSYLLSQTDQLISFAFHESTTVIEATKEAKKLNMLVTTLYLD